MFQGARGVTSSSKRVAWIFFAWFLCGSLTPRTVNGMGIKSFHPSSWSLLDSEKCPESCKAVFLKLEDGPIIGGGKVQHVEVQERGEPKSGTGFMFEWAVGALAHSCMYLQSAYGGASCRIDWTFSNRTLIFDPHLAADDPGPCSCDDVDRVTIQIVNHAKHTLPVEAGCNWSRRGGIARLRETTCVTQPGGERPNNMTELWECVKESDCRITDDRLQMAVMRDPRASTVSAYFHKLRVSPWTVKGLSVDEFVSAYFTVICQWVSIRYLLFSNILGTTSNLFWYDDAQANPMEWHQQFLLFVGLRFPDDVVSKAADVASQGGHILGFPSKVLDEHNGGQEATVERSYTDEVTAATLKQMDSELGLWLPDAVLEHLVIAT